MKACAWQGSPKDETEGQKRSISVEGQNAKYSLRADVFCLTRRSSSCAVQRGYQSAYIS
jgi:hypothetical protein